VPVVDASGHGPLHFACAKDTSQNLEVLNCLLCWQKEERAALYVDLADKVKGSTPLHTAAAAGAPECLRMLLGASASPFHARHIDGFTALHAAAAAGQHACCRCGKLFSALRGLSSNSPMTPALFSATAAMLRNFGPLVLNPIQRRSHSLPPEDASTLCVCCWPMVAVRPIGMPLLQQPRVLLPHFFATYSRTNFGRFLSILVTFMLLQYQPCVARDF
jgi:hypothetical protein